MLCFPVTIIPLRYVPLWIKAQAVQTEKPGSKSYLVMCISFLLLKQITTNIVTQNFITLQFWKSEVFWSSAGWNQGISRTLLPPGILRKSPFLSFFQDLEVMYIPGLEVPSTIFKANKYIFNSLWLTLLRLHLFSDSDPSASLVTTFGPSR